MDAVEFINEKYRMCELLNYECRKCKIDALEHGREGCWGAIRNHPEEAVAIVEQWGKEHPLKTRQSELLEWLSKRFPRMNQDNFWWRDICPKDIDSKVKCPVCANGMTMHCSDCREIYWLSEVDDNGN